ncbi:MAG: hypothetical protein R2764_04775 [Bacteroidales bacterium]
MKKLRLTILSISILQFGAFSQSIETRFQTLLDSMYTNKPAAVGIMVHVESPERGISWSGSSGFSDKEATEILESNQPALIAICIKTWVSATVLRLVEEKKITTQQAIKNLLSEKNKDTL